MRDNYIPCQQDKDLTAKVAMTDFRVNSKLTGLDSGQACLEQSVVSQLTAAIAAGGMQSPGQELLLHSHGANRLTASEPYLDQMTRLPVGTIPWPRKEHIPMSQNTDMPLNRLRRDSYQVAALGRPCKIHRKIPYQSTSSYKLLYVMGYLHPCSQSFKSTGVKS